MGDKSSKIVLPPFQKGFFVKGKYLLPKGANSMEANSILLE